MHSTVKSPAINLKSILAMLLAFFIASQVYIQPVLALNDGQQLVLESWSLINEGYLDPIKLDEIKWRKLRQKALEKNITTSEEAYSAIEEMLFPLKDPYTRLLRPKDFAAMKASNLGSEINGVGLQLGSRKEDNQIVVIAPLEGSPAEDAGLISGTVLKKVDGASPQALGLEATASRLRGESGSQVILEVIKPGEETEEVTLERRSVDLRPVRTRRLRSESHTVGYLRITQFSEGVPQQVQEALEDLLDKDVEGLILDLRNNSGGLVSSGLAVADYFLKGSAIVETKNKEGIRDPIMASNETFYDGPIVTLVNGGTASASEILAGALQDNNRSELIGSITFGKGLIQSLSTLSDGSGLALTVASYLTPEGKNIHNLGIEPNRTLDLPEPLNPGSDEDRWIKDAELYLGANIDRNHLNKNIEEVTNKPEEVESEIEKEVIYSDKNT